MTDAHDDRDHDDAEVVDLTARRAPDEPDDIDAVLAQAYRDEGFEDEEAWLAALDEEVEEANRQAGAFLREHLADGRGLEPPAELEVAGEQLCAALERGDADAIWMRHAAAVAEDLTWPHGVRMHPVDVLFRLVPQTIALHEDPQLPAEEQASLMTLEHVDWLGAITELVRAGVGAPADADALVEYTASCPEIEGDPVDPDDESVLAAGFEVALRGWRVAGIVDQGDRLTRVGAYLLPRAACIAWDTDFDHPTDDLGDD